MKTVNYPRSLQWVGDLHCPECGGLTPAWRSSGMSECGPHFYCDRCSNVFHRAGDRDAVRESRTQAVLDRIAATLPECPCGGRLAPGANPNCAHCGAEIPHQDDAVARLGDPQMIVVDCACVFGGQEPYVVRIGD